MIPKIISLGAMYVDINATSFPSLNNLKANTEVIGSDYEMAPGGSALNFARFCAHLDLSPIFIGKVGNDIVGQNLIELVKQSKIKPHFILDTHVKTNMSINYVTPTGDSLMTVVGSANQALRSDEIEKKISEIIGAGDLLYLGGCFKLKKLLPHFAHIAEMQQKKGAKIILDHGRITNAITEDEKEFVRKIIPFVDYYLPSKEEFLDLLGVKNMQEGFKKIHIFSKTIIIIKDAENGAVGSDNNEIISIPAFTVEPINTIGAGDSFNAGFIKAQSLGLSIKESVRYACATAALKISQQNLPTSTAIAALLQSQ